MKLEIETPVHLIDVNGLGLDKIEATPGRRPAHRCAGLATPDLAADMRVRKDYGLLSRAVLAGASGQLRNKATTAGNLLQRTRCPYFYDTNMPATSASPVQRLRSDRRVLRQLRMIGSATRASRPILPTWPSPCAHLMRRLKRWNAQGRSRTIPIADFHRLPGDTPHIDTNLGAGRTHHGGDAAQADRRRAPLRKGA
jgi:xanthine dehydrogenase YagS FAD-binding subunit